MPPSASTSSSWRVSMMSVDQNTGQRTRIVPRTHEIPVPSAPPGADRSDSRGPSNVGPSGRKRYAPSAEPRANPIEVPSGPKNEPITAPPTPNASCAIQTTPGKR